MWFRPYLDWIPLKIADSSTCLYKKNGNTKIFSQKRVTPRWIYTKFRLQDNKTKSGSLAMATRYNRYKLHNTKRPLTSSSAQKRKPAFMEVGLVGYHEKEKNQEKPNSQGVPPALWSESRCGKGIRDGNCLPKSLESQWTASRSSKGDTIRINLSWSNILSNTGS